MLNPALPESQSNIPPSWLVPIGRKPVLKGGLLGLVASQLPDLAFAQQGPVRPYPAEGAILNRARVGETTDEELAKAPFDKKEDLGDGVTRYSYARNPNRPSMAIAKGRVIFTRQVTTNISNSDGQIGDWSRGAPIEARVPAPDHYNLLEGAAPYFYRFPGGPNPENWETLVYASQGLALVVNKRSQRVAEVHNFKPGSVDYYRNNWNQGDYLKPTAAPESKTAPAKPMTPTTPKLPGLIMLNGLSTNRPLMLDLGVKHAQIGHFSYQGGEMIKAEGKLPQWKPFPYTYEDTWIRSIKDHAMMLKVMIDQFGEHFRPLDLVGYSLGGVIAWEYLKEFVLPADGPHRDGFIRSFVSIHSPLGGIPHSLIPNWFQVFGVENGGSNQISQYLSAQGEKLEQTMEANIAAAKFLNESRGIRILTLGNKNDRLIEEDSAVIPGFGAAPSLGPDFSGLLSIYQMLRLARLPGGLVQNIGHDQLLTTAEGRKLVEQFLNS